MKNVKVYKRLISLSLVISMAITGGIMLKNRKKEDISEIKYVDTSDDLWLDNPILGFDLSVNNNEEKTDWDKLKNNFEFSILRCSIGFEKDTKYDYFYEKCMQNNISTGAYFYNKCYHDDDFEEFKTGVLKQSDTALNSLKNKYIIYPVYIDIEDNGKAKVYDLSPDELNFLLHDWLSKANENHYIPGIYCNKSTYSIIKDKADNDLLSSFELWISGSKYYYSDDTSKELSISDISYQDNIIGDTKYQMNQISNIISGIGFPVNDYNHMDVNYCYVDYERTNNEKEDKQDKNKIERIIILSAAGVFVVVLSSSITATKINNKRKIERLKKRAK